MELEILWKSEFKMSDQEIAELQLTCPEGENFTFWCLKSGAIDNNQYINWAQKQYELPFISDNYFYENKDSLESLYTEFERKDLWSANSIPVAKWDGVLYVAIVEPAQISQEQSGKVQFLIASPDILEVQWHKFNSSYTSTIEDANTTVQTVNAPISETQPLNERSTLEDTSSSAEDLLSQLEAVTPEATNNEFTLEVDGTANEVLAELELSVVNATIPEVNNLDDTDSNTEGLIAQLEAKTEVSHAAIEAAETLAKEAPQATELETLTATSAEPTYSSLFKKINNEFIQSALLELNGDSISLVAQDGQWPTEGFTESFDISQPCIFNIVTKTNKAFHGKAFPNQTNKAFFKYCGLALGPEHISVCPIYNNGNITGFVVATGERGTNLKLDKLKHIEACTEELKDKVLDSELSAAA